MNTIEVEIRGRLDDAGYNRLKAFLDENGKHIKSQEREMIMLRDYRGFVKDDFVGRPVDIRLRNTNGACEIMLKRKVENAREEVQLKLQDNDLETAKKIMKALGCDTGNWMHRLSEIYTYNDIEWSLVTAPNNISYYEAEIAVDDVSKVAEAHAKLETEAQALNLDVLDDVGTTKLIHQLDTEANKVIEL